MTNFKNEADAKSILFLSLKNRTHRTLMSKTTAFYDSALFLDSASELSVAFGFKSRIDDYQAIYMSDFFQDAYLILKEIQWSFDEFGSIYHKNLLRRMIEMYANDAAEIVLLRLSELNSNLNKKTQKVIKNSHWLESVSYSIDDFGIIC